MCVSGIPMSALTVLAVCLGNHHARLDCDTGQSGRFTWRPRSLARTRHSSARRALTVVPTQGPIPLIACDRGPGRPGGFTCRLRSGWEWRGQFTTRSQTVIAAHMWKYPTRFAGLPGRSVELHMFLERNRRRPVGSHDAFGSKSDPIPVTSSRVTIPRRAWLVGLLTPRARGSPPSCIRGNCLGPITTGLPPPDSSRRMDGVIL